MDALTHDTEAEREERRGQLPASTDAPALNWRPAPEEEAPGAGEAEGDPLTAIDASADWVRPPGTATETRGRRRGPAAEETFTREGAPVRVRVAPSSAPATPSGLPFGGAVPLDPAGPAWALSATVAAEAGSAFASAAVPRRPQAAGSGVAQVSVFVPAPDLPAPGDASVRGAAEEGAAEAGAAGAAAYPDPVRPAPAAVRMPVVAPLGTLAEPQAPTAEDVALVRRSLEVLGPVADRATAHFYALLFLRYPQLRELFPASMDVQRDRVFQALLQAARSAGDDPVALTAHFRELGRAHRKFGVLPEHYPPVGVCLIAALERYCGLRWDAATERAWRRLYALVSSVMMNGAADDAAVAPAWWRAEITTLARPAEDVAVLTLRTDQPYPYRAGQYAHVETPWWPRVWRPYSFGCAPQPDQRTLAFHIKAVPGGWVSNALVHRARPGDVVRLGPPAGDMVLDHSAPRDLLCVGGGTGIAPLRAILEEAAEHGHGGAVELYYGARRASDLYALDDVRALARRHGRCAVYPVTAERLPPYHPDELGLCGTLPQVLRSSGPWRGQEVFLSGPPEMVRYSIGALRDAGCPAPWIHHDAVATR
jgi:NAD(P)H-flavin reductase/hemoglobin-like flavoprotein